MFKNRLLLMQLISHIKTAWHTNSYFPNENSDYSRKDVPIDSTYSICEGYWYLHGTMWPTKVLKQRKTNLVLHFQNCFSNLKKGNWIKTRCWVNTLPNFKKKGEYSDNRKSIARYFHVGRFLLFRAAGHASDLTEAPASRVSA